ncbi:hypothetical protein [Shewanella sp. OMA3-2]|uniref:hypothetical protein n=1 Tax=Shewanella sp. OMA3-2 TaxID=2908650 RepID=UPI001F19FE0B|nr:hypothetical protein [Shewanella sp. OMA3-2]UJF22389.1 hypothetical protein L0B17_02905 [Shewanella sp. OMA3-2]
MGWVRKVHKWMSVIVGLQFVLWLASGLYFNLMDHTKAGGHTYRQHAAAVKHIDMAQLVEPKAVLQNHPDSVALETIFLLGSPYYQLTHKQGLYAHLDNQYTLVDAYTGKTLELDKIWIGQLAKASYSGPGELASIIKLNPPIADFPKQQNVTWQVSFTDDVDTQVYVEAQSGRIVGHSDSDKKLADIFFMLHFMDYTNEGSFNNVQMMLLAFFNLWLTFTGVIWSVDLLRKGKYRIKRKSASR